MLTESLKLILPIPISLRQIVKHILVSIHQILRRPLFNWSELCGKLWILNFIIRSRSHLIIHRLIIVLGELLRKCAHELVS